MNNPTYHIGCRKGNIKSDVLVFGDPDRVHILYELVDCHTIINEKRGYITGNAKIKDYEFTFASLGIGGPSWMIGLYELAECGAKNFIRAGTAGIINKNVLAGDLVVPTAIISDETISKYLLPEETPLTPDQKITHKLIEAAIRKGYAIHQGEVHSKDFLYMEESAGFPLHEQLKERMEYLRNRKTLVTEMECAALFAFGLAKNHKTAAILAAINEDPKLSKITQRKAIEVSLDVLLEGV
jgi:uridine phosphorylase